MNVVSLGRSLHYINNNYDILNRIRLVVSLNESLPVVTVDRLGRSIYNNTLKIILFNSTFLQVRNQ